MRERRPRPNPAAAIPLAALAIFSLYAAGKYVRGLIYGFPDPYGLRVPAPAPSLASARPAPSLSVPASPVAAAAPSARPKGDAERAFLERFGENLKIERGADGRAVALRGAPGEGRKANGAFSTQDEEPVRSRAREVLDAGRELLGIEAGAPLGESRVKTGPVSAQAYFQETLDGVPVAPMGSVTVDLGSQGEVLNVSSDYARGLHAVNERKLGADQARAKAEAAVPEPNSALGTLGGNAVVWVTRAGPGGAPVGHHAYDFNVAGRQVVIDADNGEVLFRRDRRVH